MKHYKVTEDFRRGLNDYFGFNYVKGTELGHEMYRLESYYVISKVSPKKAKLLLATLFPEELNDFSYLCTHKDEILNLAKKLHVEKKVGKPEFHWTDHMVKLEAVPRAWSGFTDEEILSSNIIRFI